jgi:hypothetical protein
VRAPPHGGVTGSFFAATSCPSGCEVFNTLSTQTPAFTQSFPDILFDSNARPFSDTILDASGAPVGTIVAQGNNLQAGAGTLLGGTTATLHPILVL